MLVESEKFRLRKNTQKALNGVKKDIIRESGRVETILGVTVLANDAEIRNTEELKKLDRFATSSKNRGGNQMVR